jgi:hypothetical protein
LATSSFYSLQHFLRTENVDVDLLNRPNQLINRLDPPLAMLSALWLAFSFLCKLASRKICIEASFIFIDSPFPFLKVLHDAAAAEAVNARGLAGKGTLAFFLWNFTFI